MNRNKHALSEKKWQSDRSALPYDPEDIGRCRQGRSSDSFLLHAFPPPAGTVAKECAVRDGTYSYGNSP